MTDHVFKKLSQVILKILFKVGTFIDQYWKFSKTNFSRGNLNLGLPLWLPTILYIFTFPLNIKMFCF